MKKSIRQKIREAIGDMSEEMCKDQSIDVCQQVSGSQEWKQARVILMYCALPDEVSLHSLIEKAYDSGKTVVLPVVDGEDLLLRIYHPQNMAVQGRFQIEEPTVECQLFTDVCTIDLALIPGRAFTSQGIRLGRGKGYYDRLLPQLTCQKWGVAFACQRVDYIPTDEWDVNMEKIIFAKQ